MSKPRINVRVPRSDLDDVDDLVDAGEYRTRSHAVRDAIRRLVEDHGRDREVRADGGTDARPHAERSDGPQYECAVCGYTESISPERGVRIRYPCLGCDAVRRFERVEREVATDGGRPDPSDRIRPVSEARPERRHTRQRPATVVVERAGDHRREQVVVELGDSRTLEVHGAAEVTVTVPEDDG